jgi:AraC-like DNA-binding protein
MIGGVAYDPLTVMVLLDQIARVSTIGLLAVLAVVLLREWRRVRFAVAAVAFFSTIAAHVVLTSPGYAGVRGLDAMLMAAAFAVPGAFLLFSRAFFDDQRGASEREVAIVAALVAAGFMRGTALAVVGTALYYGGSLAVVVFELARVVRGLPGDLVEPRRRLRVGFTLAVGITILLVIAGEILLAGDRPPRWVDAAKSTGALGLTFLFATWLVSPRAELFAAEPVAVAISTQTEPPASAPAEDVRFRDRLLTLMRDERFYRQEGLTLAVLSRKIEIPEYRLRRVINQQLGYRNFNAFVNDFRIDDACRLLADPAQERLPILNLALDLGFGSPGPFNRAFRARTGQTPTEYRRAESLKSSPISTIGR